MKLSLPDISIRPCLLALASALILPMPASYADTVLTANLTGALEIPSVMGPVMSSLPSDGHAAELTLLSVVGAEAATLCCQKER